MKTKLKIAVFAVVTLLCVIGAIVKSAPTGGSVLPIATTTAVGGVAPDGVTLSVASNGVMSTTYVTGLGTNAPLVLTAMIAWTNTNAFPVWLVYTNGVTNIAVSNALPTRLYGGLTQATQITNASPSCSPFLLGVNWVVTNIAAGAIVYPAP